MNLKAKKSVNEEMVMPSNIGLCDLKPGVYGAFSGAIPLSSLNSEVYYVSSAEIDPYTTDTFQSLYETVTQKGNELYITVVTDSSGFCYPMEAYSFFLHTFKSGHEMKNPLTGLPISDYSLYKATCVEEGNLLCTLVYTKDKMEEDSELYRLPILWNYPECSDHNRQIFMLEFAEKIEESDPSQALMVAEKAAALGSINAKYYLSGYFRRHNNPDKLRFWLGEALKEDPNPSVHNSLLHAFHLVKNKEHGLAFPHVLFAAQQGSFWGILQVLIHLEERLGTDKDLEEAAKWRAQLPEDLRNITLDEIDAYLNKIQYPLNHTGIYSK